MHDATKEGKSHSKSGPKKPNNLYLGVGCCVSAAEDLVLAKKQFGRSGSDAQIHGHFQHFQRTGFQNPGIIRCQKHNAFSLNVYSPSSSATTGHFWTPAHGPTSWNVPETDSSNRTAPKELTDRRPTALSDAFRTAHVHYRSQSLLINLPGKQIVKYYWKKQSCEPRHTTQDAATCFWS